MSQRRDDHQTSSPKLDEKMNLSPPSSPPPPPPPVDSPQPESPTSSATTSSSETSSEMSIDGSCVSSEADQDQTSPKQSSSITVSPMVLVGCPQCLMYVILVVAGGGGRWIKWRWWSLVVAGDAEEEEGLGFLFCLVVAVLLKKRGV